LFDFADLAMRIHIVSLLLTVLAFKVVFLIVLFLLTRLEIFLLLQELYCLIQICHDFGFTHLEAGEGGDFDLAWVFWASRAPHTPPKLSAQLSDFSCAAVALTPHQVRKINLDGGTHRSAE